MGDDTEHKVELVRVPRYVSSIDQITAMRVLQECMKRLCDQSWPLGCRQEQVYEREAVFGRDASSVFPTEGQKAAAEAKEALKSKLGANRFISETEVRQT